MNKLELAAQKGLKLMIIGIAVGLIVPFLAAVASTLLEQYKDLVWIPLTITILGVVASGILELVGEKISGKACPHFMDAFRWQMFALIIVLVYYVSQMAYELTKTSWLVWPSSIINWFNIILDLLVLWCVTRGCAEATDDEDKIVRLANATFLIAIIAEGLIIVINVITNINNDWQTILGLSSSVLLLVSSIMQIILIVKSYKNIYIPE